MTSTEQTSTMPAATLPAKRIHLLDAARGVALIAMAIYHFTWDLDYFGYVPSGLSTTGGWAIFAHMITGSFLFIAGYSLYMAHGKSLRLTSFSKRLIILVAASAAISATSYFTTPGAVIYFGILHNIAAASVIGLLFVRAPVLLTFAAAIAVYALPHYVRFEFLDPSWLAWIGMAQQPPPSNDYVPLIPWLAPFLAGIAVSKLSLAWLKRQRQFPKKEGILSFFGRHSLIFYLLHQPVLFGLVWSVSMFAPPDVTQAYLSSCQTSCELSDDQAFCKSYCACTLNALEDEKLLTPLMRGATDDDDRVALGRIAMSCSIQQPE